MRLVQFDIYFSHHFHIFMLNYIAYIIRYEIIMMQWLIVRFLLTVKIRQCCKFRCYTDSSIIAFVITMIELCCMLQVQKTLLARLPSPGLLLQDSGACLTAYIFVHSILPRHTVLKAINIQAVAENVIAQSSTSKQQGKQRPHDRHGVQIARKAWVTVEADETANGLSQTQSRGQGGGRSSKLRSVSKPQLYVNSGGSNCINVKINAMND